MDIRVIEAPPQSSRGGRAVKYGRLYAAIVALQPGQAVSVTTASRLEAQRARNAAGMKFTAGQAVHGKRLTSWLSKDGRSLTLWLVDRASD